MAILQEQMSKSINPFMELVKDDVAPAGTVVATIIDIKDQFGVVRPSFDNPSVTEVVDLTTFLFGFRDQAGQPHRIASKTMRISGNEKSNLFGFLKSALGSAPKYGWDYMEMKGKKCLITVAHEAKRNGQGVFPTIAALCPVPSSFALQGNGYGGQGGMAGSTGSPQAAGNGGQRAEAGGQTGGTLNAQRSTLNAQAQIPAPAAAPVVDEEPLPF